MHVVLNKTFAQTLVVGSASGSAFGQLPAGASLKAQGYRKFFGGPEQVLKLLQGAGPCLWSWNMIT